MITMKRMRVVVMGVLLCVVIGLLMLRGDRCNMTYGYIYMCVCVCMCVRVCVCLCVHV